MKNYFAIICIALFFTGCAANTEFINTNYEKINFDDGITLEEAKTIAQKQILITKPYDDHLILNPKVFRRFKDVPNSEDYWFISFDREEQDGIQKIFLVSINKKDGDIVYSRLYLPGEDWILHAAFERLLPR